jgi:hypothetical protein
MNTDDRLGVEVVEEELVDGGRIEVGEGGLPFCS